MIKAIDTKFDGHYFRSRLEARWAVFFNELGYAYQYEKEGFKLSNGVWYLPDFYIPSLHLWIEVSSPENIYDKIGKLQLLSYGFKNDFVMLADGVPVDRLYRCWHEGKECASVTISSYIKQKEWGVPYFMGNWNDLDKTAMLTARMKRFEFDQ